MPTQIHRTNSKPSLLPPAPKHTRPSRRPQIQLRMIRNIEIVPLAERRGETLGTAPGHVLRGHDCAVELEDEVQVAVADDCSLVLFDHAWEDGEGGEFACVSV